MSEYSFIHYVELVDSSSVLYFEEGVKEWISGIAARSQFRVNPLDWVSLRRYNAMVIAALEGDYHSVVTAYLRGEAGDGACEIERYIELLAYLTELNYFFQSGRVINCATAVDELALTLDLDLAKPLVFVPRVRTRPVLGRQPSAHYLALVRIYEERFPDCATIEYLLFDRLQTFARPNHDFFVAAGNGLGPVTHHPRATHGVVGWITIGTGMLRYV